MKEKEKENEEPIDFTVIRLLVKIILAAVGILTKCFSIGCIFIVLAIWKFRKEKLVAIIYTMTAIEIIFLHFHWFAVGFSCIYALFILVVTGIGIAGGAK